MRCLSTTAGLRRRLLTTSALLALATLSPLPVSAATLTWTGAGGTQNWPLAGNWSTNTTPTAADAVILNNGATPVVVTAAGSVAKSLTLGSTAGQTGTLTVDGAGRLNVGSAGGDYFLVGDFGTGTVIVSNGGKVTSTTAVLGNNAGSTGNVTVTGTGSEWTTGTLELGDDNGATGTFRVENGGKLTIGAGQVSIGYVDANATGTLTIDGAGSSFTQTSGIFIVGRTGSGTFNVQNGATATTNFFISVGSGGASRGFVTVSGTGSQWSTGTLQIGGTTAQGTMTVSAGGTVTTTTTTAMIAAAQLIGTGVVTVTGTDSLWKITGNYSASALAINGATNANQGLLRIENGGKVLVDSTGTSMGNSDVRLGIGANTTAKLVIDGASSSFTTPYRIFAGYNNNSAAQITISNGGALNTGAAYISAGTDATAATADSVTITGANAVWTISDTLLAPVGNGEGLIVGQSGRGILTLTDGGKIKLTNPNSLLVLAGGVGSEGTLNIGAASGDPAAAPGVVEATAVVFTSTAGAGSRTINFNHTSSNYVFGARINGGAGTVNVLAGTTIVPEYSFAGTTNIAGGATLQMGNGNNISTIGSTVVNNGTLVLNYAGSPTFQGGISGAGVLVKNGTNQVALEGTSYTYTGGTQINGGTLAFGVLSGSTPQNGVIAGNVAVASGASALLRRATSYTYAGVISGAGSFQKEGAGRVTLTGANSFTGGTTIWSGVLAIGANDRLAATGALRLSGGTFDTNGFSQTVGDISGSPTGVLAIGAGRITTTGTTNISLSSTITGTAAGAFIKHGSATLTLTGTSSFAGATTVNGGVLLVNGGLASSTLAVNTGGTLGGNGTVGDTSVTGGTLRGIAGQTLTLKSLALAGNAVVTAALGAPSSTALFSVTNNLTLGGTLNITNAGSYGVGVYRLVDYGGTLTDNGLTVGSQPAGTEATVQTAVAQQVNLLVAAAATPPPDFQFWNGATTTANNAINSGPGTWTPSGQTNWTDANGARNDSWNGKFAVFQATGTGGPVTVADGGVSAKGLQFIGDWQVSGDSITLAGDANSTTVRVGDGSAAGASSRAVIGAVLTGAGALLKDDLGTLVLAADNTYAGGTTIANGTLVLGDGGTAGSVQGDIANNAILVFNRSDAITIASVISGTGAVQVAGGTVSLTGANSYSGGTAIASGATLRLADAGNITGNVANSGTLAFARNVDTNFAGVISGTGTVQIATNIVSLTGTNTFSGGTTIASGATLRLADAGSITGNVANSGTLAFAPNIDTSFAGVISGSGSVQIATSTVSLTGANSYSGGTTIASGATLRLADAGSITGNVANSGTLAFARNIDTSFAGVISGSGGVQIATNIVSLTGGNTFSGDTTIASGATLRLADAGLITGNVANGGTLAFARNVDTSFAGVISGSGGVEIATSTVSLTGANSYSGGTTIASGATLRLADAGNITGNVANGGTLVFARNTDTSFAGVISGTGAVQVAGGTVILTGANTFSGGTTIASDATLRLADAGLIAGNVANGGTLAFARNADTSFAGVISGSGSVQIATNIVSLTGTNTFSGGTTIASGATLRLADAGSITGNVANSGSFVFARNIDTSFAGVISGSGSVQIATSTGSLTGANTYTGGTTIASGATLRLADAGSITGNVANSGSFVFARNIDTSFAGVISGSGSVQIATSTGSLTGANTYTGGTTISNGATLRIADNGNPGNIANNGTLVFSPSGNLTYAGLVSGVGVIRQQTPGIVTLTGNSSGFAGTTTIAQGALAVNGALGGTVEVQTNGRLQGAGAIGGVRVASGATVAPGNSIGTLSAGNVTFTSGSVYEVETDNAGNSDRIAASGTATLQGGMVRVLAGAGNYDPSTGYTILTAMGGVNGRFDTVTSNLAFLTPTLGYSANTVTLTLERNALDFAAVGGTPNQRAAGAGVQSLSATGGALYDAVLRLDIPGARAAFDQVSGEIHASLRGVLIEDSRLLRDSIASHLRDAPADGISVWGAGFGGWRQHFTDGNAARIASTTGGFAAGADIGLGDGWRLGAAGSYARSEFDVAARTATGGSDTYQIALYGGGDLGAVRLKAGFAYGWNTIDTARTATMPSFADTLAAGYDAQSVQLFGEASHRFDLQNISLEPFVALAHVRLDVDGFAERGSAAALRSRDGESDITFAGMGLRLTGELVEGLRAHGALGWSHAFGNTTPQARFAFASGQDFGIAGAPLGRESGLVETGIAFTLLPDLTLDLSYNGQFSSRANAHALSGRFSVRF